MRWVRISMSLFEKKNPEFWFVDKSFNAVSLTTSTYTTNYWNCPFKKKNEMILHVNARCRHFYTTRNSIAFRLARLAPTTGGLILSNLQSHFRRTQEFFSAQEKVPFAFTAGRPFTYIYIGKNPRCCLILLGEWGDEKEKCVQRRVCTSRAWPFSLKRSSCVCVCWSRPDRFYMAAFDRTEALWVIRSRGRFFPVYSCCSRVKTKRNKTKKLWNKKHKKRIFAVGLAKSL